LTELRRPVLLDPARHERAEFESGEPSLDAWLRRYAGQSRRRDTAATWVIADAVDRVVAYASIAMTAIDRSCAPARVAKGSPDPVAHVLATAVELNAKAACRAVVVSALSKEARRWWTRLGLQPLDPGDSESLDLYLLTADIDATLGAS
jgi:hypothetical protein